MVDTSVYGQRLVNVKRLQRQFIKTETVQRRIEAVLYWVKWLKRRRRVADTIELEKLEDRLKEALHTSGRLISKLRKDKRSQSLGKARDLRDQLSGAVRSLDRLIPNLYGNKKNAAKKSKETLKRTIEELKTIPFMDAFDRLNEEISGIIKEKSVEIWRLRPDLKEDARRNLSPLKDFFLKVTGDEWSEVKQEGPILLLDNSINGEETFYELKEMCKHLRRNNAIR